MSKKQLEKIEIICDICKQICVRTRGTYTQGIKRNGFYRCSKCSPQRNKNFWTDPDKKLSHSKSIKYSSLYYDAISRRNMSGENNGMFGKSPSDETRLKMSNARKKRIGKNSPAWKGGKTSFVQKIKKHIQIKYSWFTRIIIRDNFKCSQCSFQGKLDAHHIEPVVKIIKRIIKDMQFENNDLKFEYVINHPDIKDDNLLNGMALCRECHKKAHNNWGSHVSP